MNLRSTMAAVLLGIAAGCSAAPEAPGDAGQDLGADCPYGASSRCAQTYQDALAGKGPDNVGWCRPSLQAGPAIQAGYLIASYQFQWTSSADHLCCFYDRTRGSLVGAVLTPKSGQEGSCDVTGTPASSCELASVEYSHPAGGCAVDSGASPD